MQHPSTRLPSLCQGLRVSGLREETMKWPHKACFPSRTFAFWTSGAAPCRRFHETLWRRGCFQSSAALSGMHKHLIQSQFNLIFFFFALAVPLVVFFFFGFKMSPKWNYYFSQKQSLLINKKKNSKNHLLICNHLSMDVFIWWQNYNEILKSRVFGCN